MRWARAREAVTSCWPDVLLVAAITFLLLPEGPTAPHRGLDSSWLAGLHVFPPKGVRFGPELVFTYGPLGFLSIPLDFTPRNWVLSMLAAIVALAALTTTSYVLLRRVVPRWLTATLLALGLPFLLGGVELMGWHGTPLPVLLGALAVMWAVTIAVSPRRTPLPMVAALGGFGAFVSLVKVDAGILCISALAIALVANDLRVDRGAGLARATGVFVLTLAGGAAAMWLLTGQRLGDAPEWVHRSLDIITGYASAMGLEDPDLWFEYMAALLLVVLIGVGVVSSRSTTRDQKVALVAVLTPVMVIAFRQGFVRHPQHAITFFVLTGFVTIAVAPTVRRPIAITLAAATLVIVGVAGSFSLRDRFDPGARAETARALLRTVADSSERDRARHNRDIVRAEYGFSPSFLEPIGAATVAIQPFDLMAAYAYPELDWRPLPVFQDYSAYTSTLDEANANALRSPEAPEFIVRQPGLAIDGRWPRWEPPEATLELACRYREVGRENGWVLLQRGENRCGELRTVSTAEQAFGETVTVPAADDVLVVARFAGIDDAWLDRLRTALFRAPEYFVDIGDGGRRRVVPGSQTGWHVVHAPECVSGLVDGQTTNPTSLRFLSDAWAPGNARSVTTEFAVVPIEC
jgi:hypothetical protein